MVNGNSNDNGPRPRSGRWDESRDFIIVGSGAGAVTAALRAKEAGLDPLILEKTEALGGSTAISGGVAWIPNNPVGRRAGVEDSQALAAQYLEACAAMNGATRGASPERRGAFLREGPEAIGWLEARGMKFRHPEGYSDYHEGELPGGVARSRSLVAPPFDARRLGRNAGLLRRNRMSKTGVPATADELSYLSLNGSTWKSRMTMLKLAWYMLRNRLGADFVGFGGAVQGRLLEIALREGLDMRTDAGVDELVVEDGAVRGVEATIAGRKVRIEARRGVLLNAGGFAHNAAMRQQYLPQPTSDAWTMSNPGETGEILQAAQRAGAALEAMELAWWVPGSILPNGMGIAHPGDVTKPFGIMVDAKGQRFVNESTSYVQIGISMYARNAAAASVPAWFVCDRRHRLRYRWGGIFPPGPPPQDWIDSGYCIAAPTIPALAQACGIDPAGLAATVERFNRL